MPTLPPGVQSTNLAAFPQIAYDKIAVEEWYPNTPFLAQFCDPKTLPRRSGRTNQLFGQRPYSSLPTVVSEGIPGPSQTLSQVLNAAFLDEYGSFLSYDNVADDMFISDVEVQAVRAMGNQAALTGNFVAVQAFETAATADSTSRIDLGDNEFLLSSTIRRGEAQLSANNVPVRAGSYNVAGHSFVIYDLFSDNSAGSAIDTWKRSDTGAKVLAGSQSGNFATYEWAGCKIIKTNTVQTTAAFPSAGKTGYSTYVVGAQAMFANELMGASAPRNSNYKLMVKRFKGDADITPDNPMLQIRGIVSYDFYLGVCARPNTNGTAGFRRIRGEVSAA